MLPNMGSFAQTMQGFGSMFTPAATPAAGAAQAIDLTKTATSMNMAGAALSGIGGATMAGYQSTVARNNAAMLEQEATQAREMGQSNEAIMKMRTGEHVAAQKAGFAANGVDTGYGSAKAVTNATQMEGDFNAQLTRYNAERQALGYLIQARNQKAQSQMDTFAGMGDLVGAGFKMGQSYISGSSAINNMKGQWGLAAGKPDFKSNPDGIFY